MLRSIISVLFVFFILNISSVVFAEEVAETARAPHESMKKIRGMLGEWTAITEMITQEGDWIEQKTDHVAIKSELDGLLFAEQHLARISGEGFYITTDLSYDQYRETYRVSAIGNGWGIMDIYEGQLDNGILDLNNIRAGTSFPLEDGREMFFRLLIPVDGDRRVMDIDMSLDEGETWSPFYRVTYERIG